MSDTIVCAVIALHLPCERLLPLAKECLASLRAEKPAHIIGVSVGPQPPERLAQLEFDHLLQSDHAVLANAWNRGIAKAFTLQASHILLLHHDIILRPGALDALLELDARYSDIAAWSPRLTDSLDSLEQQSKNSLLDPFLSYSCALFKAKTFECVGLFDESFAPRHGEVHDFHQRMLDAKQKVLTTSRAHAFHLGAAVLKYLLLEGRQEEAVAIEAARQRNALLFAEKWGKALEQLEG
jgi:hypothetical protein